MKTTLFRHLPFRLLHLAFRLLPLALTWYYNPVLYYYGTEAKKTLELIFTRPTSGNIKWPDIESLFEGLGAKISEREGSRIGVVLFGENRFSIDLIHRQTLIKGLSPALENSWKEME